MTLACYSVGDQSFRVGDPEHGPFGTHVSRGTEPHSAHTPDTTTISTALVLRSKEERIRSSALWRCGVMGFFRTRAYLGESVGGRLVSTEVQVSTENPGPEVQASTNRENPGASKSKTRDEVHGMRTLCRYLYRTVVRVSMRQSTGQRGRVSIQLVLALPLVISEPAMRHCATAATSSMMTFWPVLKTVSGASPVASMPKGARRRAEANHGGSA